LLEGRQPDSRQGTKEEDGERNRHHHHAEHVVARGEDRAEEEDRHGRVSPVLAKGRLADDSELVEREYDNRELEADAEGEDHFDAERDHLSGVLEEDATTKIGEEVREELVGTRQDDPAESRSHCEQQDRERGDHLERLPLFSLEARRDEPPDLPDEEWGRDDEAEHHRVVQLEHERVGDVGEGDLGFHALWNGIHHDLLEELEDPGLNLPPDDRADNDKNRGVHDAPPQFVEVLDKRKAELVRVFR
jgi:hypothetical protein